MTTDTLLPPAQEAEQQPQQETSTFTHGPRTFLQNSWYYAAHAPQVKRGKTLYKVICGEHILIGRDKRGKVFAINNICPHQGMPLHYGGFDGETVMCSFHGWRFNGEGTCTEIPSLVEDQQQQINVCKIKTKSYPCEEAQGNIWVFIGDKTENLPEIPRAIGVDEYPYYSFAKNTLHLPAHVDVASIGLMDPAHVPFVHNSWWFSSTKRIHEKVKNFVPQGHGYAMLRHKPSKNATAYKLVGSMLETEISFQMPGIRTERISFNNHTFLTGFTALTPVDETHTEMHHTTYWVTPLLTPFKPLIHYLVETFLDQDVQISIKQSQGLKTNPKNLIMIIKDAGTPVRWYYQLKEEWTKASNENRPFKNPLKPETLRWRS